MDTMLTKGGTALFRAMYKNYTERIKNGISRTHAKVFSDASQIRELVPEWSIDDVVETCRELSRSGFVKCLWADDTVYRCEISDLGIVYMENRFERNAEKVVDMIDKITSVIPKVL